jgi:TrkA domain protein
VGRIQVTTLPGVGVMRTFMTAADDWIGVLELRSGARQLFVDDPSDPDTRRLVAELQTGDCLLLAELLGADVEAPVPPETIDELVDWVLVAPHSAGRGQTVGQLGLRSRTGATIVAVLRDRMHTDIAPGFLIRDGDILVLSGGPEALDQARHLLTDEADGSSGHDPHRES